MDLSVAPALAAIAWHPAWRIIPSRFPPIDLFERIADPADWEALIEIESLTNPRLRDEAGEISLVPPEERVSGPGASAIMAAFTHIAPEGARFNDATFGTFYCAQDLATAIAESTHHRGRFMQATRQRPQHFDMRVYLADVDGELYDIRGRLQDLPEIYDAGDHSAGQVLAGKLRAEGAAGIVYSSLRRTGGECAAIFKPRTISNCRQERHLAYVWDGEKIREVYEKRALES